MQLPFAKLECVGNDFVLVEADQVRQVHVRDLGALARFVCDRRFGIGSDGLLVLYSGMQPVTMRMFNPDGTEDVCGNGTRCAVAYSVLNNILPTVGVLCHGGKEIRFRYESPVATIETAPATFNPYEVPHTLEEPIFDEPHEMEGLSMRLSSLSTGSTHLVAVADQHPPDPLFERVSSQIERWPIFPARTSIMWTVLETPTRLNLRIWERGAGETLGCGTGAAAAAVVAARLLASESSSGAHGPSSATTQTYPPTSSAGPSPQPTSAGERAPLRIEVVSKGGTLLVELNDWQSSPTISGEVQMPFAGLLPLPPIMTNRPLC